MGTVAVLPETAPVLPPAETDRSVLWSGVRILAELTRLRISFAVALSAATGNLLAERRFSTGLLIPMAGVLLLACGSSVLNQVQETAIDARMKRTQNRPIPSGRLSRAWGLLIALAFVGLGFSVLSSGSANPWPVLGLAAFSIVWYNGVYTPLKKWTAFAVVPGALVGAVPPLIGWAAAGLPLEAPAFPCAAFFFLWQIPHFWLLMDWRDYENAGLPTPARHFSEAQIAHITFMWILAVGASGVFLGILEGLSPVWTAAILTASAGLCWKAVQYLRAERTRTASRKMFMVINFYALAVMICLSGNAVGWLR